MINHHVSLLSQTVTNNELCPICVPHWHSLSSVDIIHHYPRIFRQVPQWSQTSHLVLLAKTTQRWAKLIWRSVGIVVQLWSRHILPPKLQGDAGEMQMGHDGSRFFHFFGAFCQRSMVAIHTTAKYWSVLPHQTFKSESCFWCSKWTTQQSLGKR